MQRLAVIRADATARIGGGHVVRCLALAEVLQARGFECVLAGVPETLATVPPLLSSPVTFQTLREQPEREPAKLRALFPNGCDLLVVDHFERAAEFERACRPWARFIVAVDGQGRAHDADLLLDPVVGHTGRPKVLAGGDYALLRPAFAAARDRRRTRPLNPEWSQLVVGFGSSRVDDLVERVLDGLAAAGIPMAVDLLLGPHTELQGTRPGLEWLQTHRWVENPAFLLASADLVIGAGGGFALEAAAVGVPSLLTAFAANQEPLVDALVRAGAAERFLADDDPLDLGARVRRLLTDRDGLLQMAEAARNTVDARGAERVADAVLDNLARKWRSA